VIQPSKNPTKDSAEATLDQVAVEYYLKNQMRRQEMSSKLLGLDNHHDRDP
jgi:hypothetical protein